MASSTARNGSPGRGRSTSPRSPRFSRGFDSDGDDDEGGILDSLPDVAYPIPIHCLSLGVLMLARRAICRPLAKK